MIAAITTGVTTAITFVGNVIDAIFGSEGAWSDILPAVGLAVGVFVLITAVGILKSLIKGY